LESKSSYFYLNWDIDSQRTQILTKEFDASELIIFDAIKTNSVAQKKF
jgi:hypothetical protein